MVLEQIELIKMLVDFGLVVLILMVQLIAYPSFIHFPREILLKWHTIYTRAITVIVAPLMCLQLLIAIVCVFYAALTAYTILNLLLVLSSWVLTFLLFVPIHKKITEATFIEDDLQKLVKFNWWRVYLWILIFVVSLGRHLMFT